jgi:nitrite reductase (NADH) small subunit
MLDLMRWMRAGLLDEFTQEKGRTLRLRGRRVAFFRLEDRVYALDAFCPHSGVDLGLGRVHRGRVTCPDHGWTFDLATGCMPGMEEIAVRTYPVKIEGGEVFVVLPPPVEGDTPNGESMGRRGRN